MKAYLYIATETAPRSDSGYCDRVRTGELYWIRKTTDPTKVEVTGRLYDYLFASEDVPGRWLSIDRVQPYVKRTNTKNSVRP